MSIAGAAFTVRFLRNGDQVRVERRILNENGEGMALFQVVNTSTGTVAPDWEKDASKQPIIRLEAKSSAGYPVKLTGIQWAYDGATLTFPELTATFQQATGDERFMARIFEDGYELRIVKNLAGKDVVSNKQISYGLSYVSNALSDSIQGSVDVMIQQAGDSSHILQIATDRVELDAVNTSAKLTATAQHGTSSITIGEGGYTLEWWQDGVKIEGQTAATLTVTRNMVNGGSVFSAKLYKDGQLVAQDGQRINDIADEYQIQYVSTGARNVVSLSQDATYKLTVTKNGTEMSVAEDAISWQVFNALGVATKTDGKGSVVTVKAGYCMCNVSEGVSYYADVDVQVSVTL